MAATSHPLATMTAVQVLRDGGNAIDAAIAAAATLAVVEPHMTGIGGDCFALVAKPDGSTFGLDGAGRAASAARTEWYVERGFTEIPSHSPHAVTVPGAVKAWHTLLAVGGTMELPRLFADALRYAEEGYAVAPRVAHDWAKQTATLRADEGASLHFLYQGEAPLAGQRHRQPALARTLRAISQDGADAFYTGPVAEEIARTVQAKGGFLSQDDLAAVTTGFVDPLSIDYAGHALMELPPSGQGIVAMIMLNILEQIGVREHAPDSPARYHCEMEAARLAYSVRDILLAEPEHMPVPASTLISSKYAEGLAAQFSAGRRNDRIAIPAIPDSDTVYLTVVDRDRMAVSFINSLYGAFGSQIVTPESGIALQNRGACFVTDPAHPNVIAPSKRPLHTIIPAMVARNGEAAISFGVMGGSYQPVGHAHLLSNMLDYGMDPQEAIDHPRMFWDDEGVIRGEAGIEPAVLEGMSALGHETAPAEAPFGGGQAIAIDRESGFLVGGSDPRKDGCAMGW
ncbi:gamma-glutamyltransferase family protein [Oricola cellulosilytica]|uniref:Gamma-glutamyltransferase family protein n=2 Tax=Oricola cellulosilytica TaxID=1429082 RepID=A0A4R0P9T1_9HYPH|nr:gamma-glutamyltransferase family protein [Oricola cellulosilytica]TCD13911.1 gamma-glutamyltransferase family protein [Oricola cellulosilytica]